MTKRPVAGRGADAKAANDALEKALYSDMFALFLLTHAEKFDVEKGEVVDPGGNTSAAKRWYGRAFTMWQS